MHHENCEMPMCTLSFGSWLELFEPPPELEQADQDHSLTLNPTKHRLARKQATRVDELQQRN